MSIAEYSKCPIAKFKTFEKTHDMVLANRRLKVRETLEAKKASHMAEWS